MEPDARKSDMRGTPALLPVRVSGPRFSWASTTTGTLSSLARVLRPAEIYDAPRSRLLSACLYEERHQLQVIQANDGQSSQIPHDAVLPGPQFVDGNDRGIVNDQLSLPLTAASSAEGCRLPLPQDTRGSLAGASPMEQNDSYEHLWSHFFRAPSFSGVKSIPFQGISSFFKQMQPVSSILLDISIWIMLKISR